MLYRAAQDPFAPEREHLFCDGIPIGKATRGLLTTSHPAHFDLNRVREGGDERVADGTSVFTGSGKTAAVGNGVEVDTVVSGAGENIRFATG
jgi:hypothetical protein